VRLGALPRHTHLAPRAEVGREQPRRGGGAAAAAIAAAIAAAAAAAAVEAHTRQAEGGGAVEQRVGGAVIGLPRIAEKRRGRRGRHHPRGRQAGLLEVREQREQPRLG